VNSAWNIVNFRSGLVRALVNEGYCVVVAAPPDKYVEQLKSLGCQYVPLPIDSSGMNVIKDKLLLLRFFKIFIGEKPDVYLGFTVKPNIYGSMAAYILGVPVVNNITGLGAVFLNDGWLNQLVRFLYRIALSNSFKVFFQNADDRQLFITGKLVEYHRTDQLPGSGIDVSRYRPALYRSCNALNFLLIARMLWDKGVGEYVEAARVLKNKGVNANFSLLGFVDVDNPSAITRKQIDQWVEEGCVNYLGVSDDVAHEIADADCIVLPSYREGTPRTLLEAAALARPIVTTNSVGCRDVVDNGVNGYICQPMDAQDLADKMEMMTKLSVNERKLMGRNGREKIEKQFDEKIVINKYIQEISKIVEL